MAGRGYVDKGDKKAARYITAQFKKDGLLKFSRTYSQKFSFPVNTYPDKDAINLSINGKPLMDGVDYILLPSSPAMNGTFPVIRFSKENLEDSIKLKAFLEMDLSHSFVLVDDSGVVEKKEKGLFEGLRLNSFKAKGIIMLKDKLTEETSDSVSNYALIDALRNSPFQNAKEITLNIKNKFIKKYTSQNIIGYIQGEVPDTFIVFSAHYDHLGRMGNIYFPGANDNASGTAMLLTLSRYFSSYNKLHYSLAFMAFTGEEMGLFGSKYYTEHPLFPLQNIKFLVNMDIMGTGDEGITVVNANGCNTEYKDLVRINDSLKLLKEIKPRSNTSNSDHYYFYVHHVPCIFIYTLGGIKAYHDIYDRRETLPLTKFNEIKELLIDFTDDICKRRF